MRQGPNDVLIKTDVNSRRTQSIKTLLQIILRNGLSTGLQTSQFIFPHQVCHAAWSGGTLELCVVKKKEKAMKGNAKRDTSLQDPSCTVVDHWFIYPRSVNAFLESGGPTEVQFWKL